MKRLLSLFALLGAFLLLPLVAEGQQYTITFEQVEHCTITAQYGYGASATQVSSGDKVPNYTFLQITATPDPGYIVTHYIINGVERENTGAPAREMVMSDLTISARVAQVKPCTVTITPPEHGTLKVTSGITELTSGTQVNSGTTLKLEVTPETGYEIEYWLVNGKKFLPSTDAAYRNTFFHNLQDDVTLSAQLKVEGTKTLVPVTIQNPPHATIKLYKGTSAYGTEIASGESVEAGSDIAFKIEPEMGYALDYWLINGERVEKESGYASDTKTVKVVDATTISAVLKEDGYKVTYTQPEHGTLKVTTGYPPTDILSGSRVKERTRLSITATVETGYVFKHFLINGQKMASNSTYAYTASYTPTADVTIEAVIEKSAPCIVTIEPFEQGELKVTYGSYASPTIVASGDEVPAGTRITVEATVDPAYEFKHFLVNGQQMPSSSSYSHSLYYTVNAPITVAAVAEKKPAAVITIEPFEHGELEVSYGPYSNMKIVSSGDEVPIGEKLDVYVNLDEGYGLEHFLVNGVVTPDESGYEYLGVTVEAPTTLSAVAKMVAGKVTIVQPDTLQGVMTAYYFKNGDQTDVSDGNFVALETAVTFSVAPKEGYEMDYWMINDARQELETGMPNNKVITIEGNLKVQPILKEKATTPTEAAVTILSEGTGGTVAALYKTPGTPLPTFITVGEETQIPVGYTVQIAATLSNADDYEVSFTHNDQPVDPAKIKKTSDIDFLYEFKVEATTVVKAIFKAKAKPVETVPVTIQEEGFGGFVMSQYQAAGSTDWTRIKVREETQIPLGSTVRVTATINLNDIEVSFTHNDQPVPADKLSSDGLVYTFTVEAAAVVKATFKETLKPTGKFKVFYDCGKQGTIEATANSEPFTSGTEIEAGTPVKLEAHPNEGYEVEAWYDADFNPISGTEGLETYVFTVKEEVSLFVDFKKIPKPAGCKITLVSIPAEQGYFYASDDDLNDVASGSVVPVGKTIYFTVEASSDYELDHWLVNDQRSAETSTEVEVTITAEMTELKVQPVLKKKGEILPTGGTITMVQPAAEQGTMTAYYFSEGLPVDVTNGMKVATGVSVTFHVEPAAGYEMDYWMINDARQELEVGTPNNKVIDIEGDLKVQPVLKKKGGATPTEATVTLQTEGMGGFATGKYKTPDAEFERSLFTNMPQKMPIGTTVRITANLTQGFEVTYTNNGQPVPAEALSEEGKVYSFTVTAAEEITVKATFAQKQAPPVDYTVTYTAGEGGTVTATADMEPFDSGSKVPAGKTIKVMATASENYEIDQWKFNGEVLPANAGRDSYIFVLDGDVNVEVTFRSTLPPAEYAVTLQPILPNAEAGTVQLFKKNGTPVDFGTPVVTGTEMYLEVKPADKYQLKELKVNEKTLKPGDTDLVNQAGGSYKYSFTVTEATSVTATFELGGAIDTPAQSDIVAYVTDGGARLVIVGAAEGTEVRLFDYTGQLLLASTEHTLDISALPAGSYLLLVGHYTTRIMK